MIVFHQVFNLLEGLVWIGAGLYYLVRASRGSTPHPDLLRWAAITLLCFGPTDFIEIFTGSWFVPTWLLAWNAACVISLICCLMVFLRRRRSLKRD